jgi:hypothetical protein
MAVGLIAGPRLAQAFTSAGDSAALNTGVPPLNSRQTNDHASWADIDQSS